MSTDELLAILKDRGLSIVFGEDGEPRLRGDKAAASEKLLRVLKMEVHKQEIIARFRPKMERRIALVAENGEVEKVLEECGKAGMHERARNHADRLPGRIVAAEWLGPLGWVRYLTIDRRSVLANGNAPASGGRPQGDGPGDAGQSLPASDNREGAGAPDSAL